jgi:hypothetical protein
MISAEKVMNIKVVELSRSTTFIWVISSSNKVIVTLFTKFTSLSYSFMKPYERYVKFMNNITITLSDKEMTKIKVVHLDEFYHFVVDDFFS